MPLQKTPLIHLSVLVTTCLALFFSFLGLRDIWDIDEGMHAAIAQTMVLSGDWVTPIFNGEPFFDKPALFNWLNAISFLFFGFTETAARLPAATAGLGCVLLTWQLGRKLYGEWTGFLSGLILATSLEFTILSRVVQYDISFTFFTTLALFFLASGVFDQRQRSKYFLGFYVAASLATLTKGPIGLLLPGLAVGLFVIVTRRTELLRQMRILPGAVIFLAIVSPWFIMMEQANNGYLDYFIVKQHFGNFFGGEGALKPRHPEPFYYYLPVLLAGLLPWSAMLPQSMMRGLRADRDHAQGVSLFLVLWILAIFLFFSAATSKLSTYLLPVFPAAALLMARYLVEFIKTPTERGRRGLLIGIVCWLVPIMLVAAYAIPNDPWTYWNHRAGVVWVEFEIFVAIFSLMLLVSFVLLLLRRYAAAIGSLAATAPVLSFFILLLMVPDVNPYKGSKEIGLQMDYMLGDKQKIPMYGQMLDSTLFYTGRDAQMIHGKEDLDRYLDSPNRRFVLMRSRARSEADTFKGDYYVILRVGNKAIVSNQPPDFH